MAQDNTQERTEQPTQKRLTEAREKGQIARSRELNTMMVLVAGAGSIVFFGDELLSGVSRLMQDGLTLDRGQIFDTGELITRLREMIFGGLLVLLPLLIAVVIAALVAPLALGGWTFSPQALAFKWDKLHPVKGLKRVFAVRGLVELVKAFVKFALVGAVVVFWLWYKADEFVGLSSEPLAVGLGHTGSLLSWSFFVLCWSLLLIAAVDVPFQLWDHQRQLRMSRQEVKEEQKQTEGSPEMRAHIRALQREMAQRRMMEEVPKADVVVTNPTHYAVALRYDAQTMSAPVVVAKGADIIALQIRRTATQHEVAIVSAPPLARAVYHSTELGGEIPVGLYLAVAQVLAHVMQLKQQKGSDREAVQMADLPIPEELQHD